MLVISFVRFRPVPMTALAMVIGMLPMALVFVPVVFSLVHGRAQRRAAGSSLPPQSGVPVHAS